MIPFASSLPNSSVLINKLNDETNVVGNANPKEVTLFIISLIVAYIVGLIIAHYLKLKLSHRLRPDQLTLLTRLVRIILIFIAVGITVPSLLDLSFTIVLVIIVAIIVGLSLSSQSVIANMVAGLALLYEHPFGSGDFINTGDVSGTVISTRLFSVLVRTTSGVSIQIPNSQIYSSDVSNFHANVARRYEYVVGIRYTDDVQKAVGIISKLLDEYTFVLKNPAPNVFVNHIDPDSVNIMFRIWFPSVWANTKDDISFQTDVLPRVKASLEAEGIEIPYAHREIIFADPVQKFKDLLAGKK
jgi:small-conductance mechanosensitive channel